MVPKADSMYMFVFVSGFPTYSITVNEVQSRNLPVQLL